MEELDLRSIKVGDRIKFRVLVRDGYRTASRVVTSLPGESPWPAGFTVRSYYGWTQFAVRPSEIIGHMPKES